MCNMAFIVLVQVLFSTILDTFPFCSIQNWPLLIFDSKLQKRDKRYPYNLHIKLDLLKSQRRYILILDLFRFCNALLSAFHSYLLIAHARDSIYVSYSLVNNA